MKPHRAPGDDEGEIRGMSERGNGNVGAARRAGHRRVMDGRHRSDGWIIDVERTCSRKGGTESASAR